MADACSIAQFSEKNLLPWAAQVDDSKLPPGKPHSIHAPCSREPLNDLCLTLSV